MVITNQNRGFYDIMTDKLQDINAYIRTCVEILFNHQLLFKHDCIMFVLILFYSLHVYHPYMKKEISVYINC